MGIHRLFGVSIACGLLIFAATSGSAQDKTKGAAPNYPGAIGETTDSSGKRVAMTSGYGEWYTKDSISKVRAFYEPKTGPFEPRRKRPDVFRVITELLPYKEISYGEAGAFAYSTAGITLYDSTPPVLANMSDAELAKWAQKAERISRLASEVDWGEVQPGSERMPPEQREQMRKTLKSMSGKHSIKEFRDLMGRYGYLAKAFFLHSEAGDLEKKYEAKSSKIKEEREAVRQKQGDKEASDFNSMIERKRRESRENAEKERANPGSVYQATPEEKAFQDAMNKKPKLRDDYIATSNRAAAAAQRMDIDAAEKETNRAEAIVRSDPEISAAYDRMQAADKKRNQAQQAQAKGQFQQQMDQRNRGYAADQEAAGWNVWKEYIVELDKVAYRTKINIDQTLDVDWHPEAKTPGAIIRTRAEIDKQKKIGDERVAAYCSKMKGGCGTDGDEDATAGMRSGADSSTAQGKPADKPSSAKEPEKKEDSSSSTTTDALKQGADAGMQLFKKLF